MSGREGGCLCGSVRFRVTAKPLDAGYCHCRMCQKNSGAPVVAWVTFPIESFGWITGQPGTYASSAHGQRSFCAACGSYLIFVSAKAPAEVSVNTASLDAPEAFPPNKHIYAQSRIAWFHTVDDLPQYADSGDPQSSDDESTEGIELYYFAYGSNLPFLRMLERTSKNLRLKGKFSWKGRRLAFAKQSTDGSGKCTAIATSDGHVVWGTIYQLTSADKRRLAAFERGYHEQLLPLALDNAQKQGFTYIANKELINEALRPYSWYKRLVLAGAREHGFPATYIDAIERVADMPDPDTARRAKEEAGLVPIERASRSFVADL